ncbi:hypothetical protein P8452_45935 [Trifolium repens]|nr:hypothetical protein P8452_45935 [Trifolium repens]
MQLIVVQVLNGVPPTEDYSLAKYNKVQVLNGVPPTEDYSLAKYNKVQVLNGVPPTEDYSLAKYNKFPSPFKSFNSRLFAAFSPFFFASVLLPYLLPLVLLAFEFCDIVVSPPTSTQSDFGLALQLFLQCSETECRLVLFLSVFLLQVGWMLALVMLGQ